MNIQPIKMGTYEARSKAREYGKLVRQDKESRFVGEGELRRRVRKQDRHDKEYIALHKAYSALARGEEVIHLVSAFRNAGIDPKTNLPRLAIVRADAERVGMRFDSSTLLFHNRQDPWRPETHARVPTAALPAEMTDRTWRINNHFQMVENVSALVPIIPPAHRPKCSLTERYLLWEPKWEPKPPDPDPFLLRPLGGGFFVIEAKWDMTPLEQALLEGRL